MRILRGTGASAGIAIGPWVRLTATPIPVGRSIASVEVEAELVRLDEALAAAAAELDALAERMTAEGHPDEGAIFAAQAAVARGPALRVRAKGSIREERRDAVVIANPELLRAGPRTPDQMRRINALCHLVEVVAEQASTA